MSLAFVRRIHRGPVNSPHKWPVAQKMFPFDDVIMNHVITIHKPHQLSCRDTVHFKWKLVQNEFLQVFDCEPINI